MPDHSITVLVPTYNHARYICEALDSVRSQTVFDECIVVVSDDCSADRTFDLARQAACSSNIKVKRTETNLGVMRHYHELVGSVETPFTAVLEGDDVWMGTRRLQLMREMLDRNSNMGMCFSACVVAYMSSGKRIKHPAWNDGRNRIVDIIDLIRGNPAATFSNCLYRTESLKRALSIVGSCVGYDWLCNMNIALAGDVGFFAEPGTLYRIHPAGQWSRLSIRKKNAMMRQSLEVVLRHAPKNLHEFIKDAIRKVS